MAKKKRDKKLTLTDHLEELRRRIITCFLLVIVSAGVVYAYIEPIVTYLSGHIDNLVFLHPIEAFVVRLKVAVVIGFIAVLPLVLLQIISFIASGLTNKERRALYIYLPFAIMIFLGGASFFYFLVMPLGLAFLLGLATPNLQAMISINAYFSFLILGVMVFGFVFELPLVIMFLTRLGIVNPQGLRNNWTLAVVIIFLTAGILTPPDVATQFMLALPILVLYELSIFLSKMVKKSK